MTEPLQAIDPKQFWRALGPRACGGAVVTARSAAGPAGFLGLSATHLAQNPPTLLVTIGMSTSALATILDARHFAVNYLTQDQTDLADLFGGKTDRKGADRFDADRWTTLKSGAPILKDGVGAIDCRLLETIERYNTVLAIGEIVGFVATPDLKPMVYFGGKIL